MKQPWTTYHDQLDSEVSALGSNVGNVASWLKEALPVAASLWARHLRWNYVNWSLIQKNKWYATYPHWLFRFIWLVLILLLHVHAGNELDQCKQSTTGFYLGSKYSVGSGSTAPFTSLIWPGMMEQSFYLKHNWFYDWSTVGKLYQSINFTRSMLKRIFCLNPKIASQVTQLYCIQVYK